MAGHPPLIQILRRPPPSPAPGGHGGAAERAYRAGDSRPAGVEWPAVAERLREFAAARPAGAADEVSCDLCSMAIAEEHGHVVDVQSRALLCVCRPCYLLFLHHGTDSRRFRAVPHGYRHVPIVGAVVEAWDALQIPIRLAFCVRSGNADTATALYPSPAGVIESPLPIDAWNALTGAAPELATLASDVEALLVNRVTGGPGQPVERCDAVIAPIDACYELVGRVRLSWRGLQGGDAMWREVDEFFARALLQASAGVEP